jgi:cation/acetate symporter
MTLGLVSSVGLALIGPAYLGPNALWPLVNPTVVALPLGVLGAVLGSLLTRRDAEHDKRFDEVTFRIQTGVRSNHREKAET